MITVHKQRSTVNKLTNPYTVEKCNIKLYVKSNIIHGYHYFHKLCDFVVAVHVHIIVISEHLRQ